MNKDIAEVSQSYQVETAEQVVPKGYKHTEVGVIPEDWDVVRFGKLYENSISRRNLKPSEFVTFVGMQDVSESAQLVSQHELLNAEVKSGFTYFERGDVLVAKITPCFENGKGCHTEKLKTEIGFGSTEFHVLRAVNSANSKFIYFWTTRESFRNALELEMVGSAGHRRAPYTALQSYLIPCPVSKKEQTIIANALSDVDALLSELEKLIAKKQAIKTATMQQLLTGRSRLPQFSLHKDGSLKGYKQSELGEIPEDWDVKSVGQLCDYQNGSAQEHYFNSYDGYKVVSIGNYSESGRYIPTSSFIDKKLKSLIGRYVLRKGDLAMILNDKTAIGTIIGRVIHIDADESYVMNQRTMRLSAKGEVSSTYLHFLINSDFTHKRIVGMAKPGTQIYVNTDDILNFELQVPLDAEEQVAITTILSDMDEEIQALELRLNKTRQIKQGMMQELLTGKTRLVAPQVSE